MNFSCQGCNTAMRSSTLEIKLINSLLLSVKMPNFTYICLPYPDLTLFTIHSTFTLALITLDGKKLLSVL